MVIYSPTISGSIASSGSSTFTTLCATTLASSPTICGTTAVCSPTICGTSAVCTPTIYGTQAVCAPDVFVSNLVTSGCAVCVGTAGQLTAYTAGGGGGSSPMTAGFGGCSIVGNCSTAFNSAMYPYGFTGGGYFNASGCYSFVGGGCNNSLSSGFAYNTLVGGCNNCNTGMTATGLAIGGGMWNIACACIGGTIGGGVGNGSCGGTWDSFSNYFSMPPSTQCLGTFATIGGGFQNNALGCFSFVGGGKNNCNCGYSSTIVGGECNSMQAYCSVLAGGLCNKVDCYGFANVMTGGYINTICNGSYNFIGSGYCNRVGPTNMSSCYNVIVGGTKGYIDGQFGFIGNTGDCSVFGACSNTIGCNTYGGTILNGVNNQVCGNMSFGSLNCFGTILGGCGNTAGCCFSLAFGCAAYAGYPYTTVIGCNLSGFSGCTMFVNNMCVCGTLSKLAGSFRIPHPDPAKPTKDLIHSFVESPTAGENLYRYSITTIDCTATIELPDYYKHLNCDDQVFVTPKNNFGAAYGVVNEAQTCATFCSNVDGDFNVLIIGTRKDQHATDYWKGAEVNQITGSTQN